MVEIYYNTNNLFIAQLARKRLPRVLTDDDDNYYQEYNYVLLNSFIPVRNDINNNDIYYELFTNTKLTDNFDRCEAGELYIARSYSINEYLSPDELRLNKISKKRLAEIYCTISSIKCNEEYSVLQKRRKYAYREDNVLYINAKR